MATSAPSRSGGSHAKSVAEREATLDVTSCGRSQPLTAGNPLLGSPLSESKCGHLVKRKRDDIRCAPSRSTDTRAVSINPGASPAKGREALTDFMIHSLAPE